MNASFISFFITSGIYLEDNPHNYHENVLCPPTEKRLAIGQRRIRVKDLIGKGYTQRRVAEILLCNVRTIRRDIRTMKIGQKGIGQNNDSSSSSHSNRYHTPTSIGTGVGVGVGVSTVALPVISTAEGEGGG
jgi:hypothetical protein